MKLKLTGLHMVILQTMEMELTDLMEIQAVLMILSEQLNLIKDHFTLKQHLLQDGMACILLYKQLILRQQIVLQTMMDTLTLLLWEVLEVSKITIIAKFGQTKLTILNHLLFLYSYKKMEQILMVLLTTETLKLGITLVHLMPLS